MPVHALTLSVTLPDETHPDMGLCVSAVELACDVVVTVPTALTEPAPPAAAAIVPRSAAASDTASGADDACVLGGHAGI